MASLKQAFIDMEVFKCRVCLEFPIGQIFQSEHGYIICEPCFKTGSNIPCDIDGIVELMKHDDKQKERILIRCKIAEDVLDTVIFKCFNAPAGCRKTLKRKRLLSHYRNCRFNANDAEEGNSLTATVPMQPILIDLDLFKCQDCYESPLEEIFQCREGHIFCEGCVKKGKTYYRCPKLKLCCLNAPAYRSNIAETLLGAVNFDCANADAGCPETMGWWSLLAHHKICQFRSVKFCSFLGFKYCDMAVATGSQLSEHLQLRHGARVCGGSAIFKRFLNQVKRVKTEAPVPENVSRAYIWFDELTKEMFLTNIKMNGVVSIPKMEVTVYHLGDEPKKADDFIVNMRICSANDKWRKFGPRHQEAPTHFKQDLVDTRDIFDFSESLDHLANCGVIAAKKYPDNDFDLVVKFSANLAIRHN